MHERVTHAVRKPRIICQLTQALSRERQMI